MTDDQCEPGVARERHLTSLSRIIYDSVIGDWAMGGEIYDVLRDHFDPRPLAELVLDWVTGPPEWYG